jgi:3-carboxy-cis,cis-muconate cycloisomerase
VVNAAQMQRNIAASNGLMLAEAINLALAPHIGRAEAKQLIQQAGKIAQAENRHLVDVVREQVNVALDWEMLRDEANYLGGSQTFIDRVLHGAEQIIHEKNPDTGRASHHHDRGGSADQY